ncbi:MAG TPA: tRNA (guanosine(46)-N7)-methyltransferase TrmB [Bacteroidales bacterium]|nr:tRNA (guanosine(46)-N7)-methyltransferase TrmB [Bacteroidales bacterium]
MGTDHPVKGTWNEKVFGNTNPVVLELGCGKGEYTTGLASMEPDRNYIGVDIKGARMWRGAKTSHENNMTNVAFLRTRIEFITSFFGTDEVDEIWITFPDPHAGGRHSNKRLTSAWYLNSYRMFLKDKGFVHLKTDSDELFRFTLNLVEANNLELVFSTTDLHSGNNKAELAEAFRKNFAGPVLSGSFAGEILSIRTHYENMFIRSGSNINFLSFRLDKNKVIKDATPKTR